MYKDIMISLLGAWILRDAFGKKKEKGQTAIVMGLAAVLFIFLLFLENQVEKWREYRQRVRDLEQRLGQLRGGGKCERRESTGDYGKTGADTVTAVDDAG